MIGPGRSGRRLQGLVLGLGLAALTPAAPALAAEVARFFPEGLVRGIRQVEARFSAPMVPLGDPAGAPDPFDVACDTGSTGRDVRGPGRWVDSRSWVLDLGGELPAGIRCAFRLRPGLAGLDGGAVGGRREFAFSTGGPAIRASYPAAGAEDVDEEQAFVLDLDGQATEASIVAHAHVVVEGLPDRVGVRLLDGRARAVVLAARYGPGRERWPAHAVVLQARQRFPSRAGVRLVWGAGIATPGGVATDAVQVVAFRVRPAFTATFRCERENPRAGCVPVSPLRLELSADVPWTVARGIALVGPDGVRRLPRREGESGEGDGAHPAGPEREDERTVRRVVFRPPFPESTTFRIELPPGLRDDAGRPLQNASAFPLRVRTEAYPPLAKFAARFGLVERADPVLPVTLRSLEPDLRTRLLRVDQAPGPARGGLGAWVRSRVLRIPPPHADDILPWLRKVGSADRETSIFEPVPAPVPGEAPRLLDLPRPDGPAGFQVVGIPLGEPGLYVLELESRRLGAALLGAPARPLYVPAAALVTNLAVHLKWGREASLAWVTALDSGRPVRGARVTVYDCRGARRARAESDRDGIARLGVLPRPPALPRCPLPYGKRPFFDYAQTAALGGLDEGLLVVAQTVDDLGFVHSSWSQGIEPWRFQLPDEAAEAPVVAHTILDRSLFRAGETVHMKHLLRAHGLAGFSAAPPGERPTRLSIRHQGSDERHDLPITWTGSGVALSTWLIPRGTRLGRYELVLVRPAPLAASPAASPGGPPPAEPAPDPPGDREWVSGAFRVEEFRVPLLRGLVRPPPEPQVAAGAFPVDLAVHYLAGGPAAHHPATVRVQLRPRGAAPGEGPGETLEGFAVANGPVREGLERRSRGLDPDGEEEDGDPGADAASPAIHQRETLTLDAAGTGRVTVRDLPRAGTPREALVELEFRDPSGEAQTVAAAVALWPAARLAAIRPDGWVASRERLRVVAAVTDVEGRPVSGSLVRVTAFEARSYSHRKRLVGGVYGWEHVRETRRLAEVCAGMTDVGGRLVCEGPAPAEGQVVLEARTADGEGRESAAHASVWVAGSEAWWFEAREHDRMDVLPERPRYEPGETARLQVRMPFREATALVTMEREGALDAFVTTLSGQAPVVEVPIQPAFAPNMFVSVLAVRGRVGDAQPTALVDLGRPAFKLGVAEIRVGTGAHRLDVRVEPERASYRVRERVRVRIAVRAPGGGPPPRGSEVAVAAVDEGLLELAGNPSWAILEAMLGRRGHAVQTATAALQVVGRRHYGKKAGPAGGGGGRQATRELFDTLLLWQPRVALDARGEATVEVPLGDALTAVRIVAVATGGTGAGESGAGLGLFGTGRASVRVTQDLMVLPGLPPVVREGDRFRAEVTLRNTTASPLVVEVSAGAAGLPGARPAQTLTLAGGEARVVGWDAVAPAGVPELAWDFQAAVTGSAGTPAPADRVRAVQKVVPVTPVRTQQATLARAGVSAPLREPLARPARALPDRGGVEVALRPTLLAGLDGVREWMRRYPYTCMEQRTSRAVVLRDAGLWREVVRSLPAHLDDDGLLRYFPGPGSGSDVLTAYVLAVTHEAGWDLPEEARDRMLEALVKFVEGGLARPGALPAADLSLRRLTALEALSRFGKAEPKHLAALTIEPTLWPTSALLDWRSLLHRVPAIPRQAERLREAERILRARLDLSGTALAFSTEHRDGLYWLMVSADANAVRLLLHAVETGLWPDDVGRLVRGALGRQRRGAWDTTVANAWGLLAVERFSRAFESTPVDGVTAASLGSPGGDPRPAERRTLDWATVAGGGALAFPWPAGPGELLVEHAGRGEPWVTVTARAAVPLEAPRGAGYRLTRQVEPVETRAAGRLARGDVVRVRLTVEADADMTWVVLEDPVPAGASHLGTGLRRDSAILAAGAGGRGAWPAFEERGFEAYRAYFERLPRGTTIVEYTVRLGQAGTFHLPPTRVEALYAPERFGEWPNEVVRVEP